MIISHRPNSKADHCPYNSKPAVSRPQRTGPISGSRDRDNRKRMHRIHLSGKRK